MYKNLFKVKGENTIDTMMLSKECFTLCVPMTRYLVNRCWLPLPVTRNVLALFSIKIFYILHTNFEPI